MKTIDPETFRKLAQDKNDAWDKRTRLEAAVFKADREYAEAKKDLHKAVDALDAYIKECSDPSAS